MKKTILLYLFSTLAFTYLAAQTSYVDPAGNCDGNSPCYITIQAAVDATTPGETVIVGPGTYNEVINVDKSITLLSTSGRENTTITGSDPGGSPIPYPNGTITIRSNTSDVTIGGIDQGFTINGYDLSNPGQEAGAIALNGVGPINNITIEGNELVANGESAITQSYNQLSDNVVINANIISGKTFVGTEPAGCGFSTQFSELNVPRQLVTMGGGGGVTNTTNVTFTNNEVIGTTGGPSSVTGCETTGQGNNLVTIDVLGAQISGNVFSGVTARFAGSLRARGNNTTIENNVFDGSGFLYPSAQFHIFAQGNSGRSIEGTAFPTWDAVSAANVFLPNGYYIDLGPGVYLQPFPDAESANTDCAALSSTVGQGVTGLCAPVVSTEPLPIMNSTKKGILIVVVLGLAVLLGYRRMA